MFSIQSIDKSSVTLSWQAFNPSHDYEVYWSNKNLATSTFIKIGQVKQPSFTLHKATHVPHYLKIVSGKQESEVFETPVYFHPNEQLEVLDRGLIAIPTSEGVFLSWRLLKNEVVDFDQSKKSLNSPAFTIFKNGEKLATVADSTNFLDKSGTIDTTYQVAIENGQPCQVVTPWEKEYLDLPLNKPKDGITPSGDTYSYHANDVSVADMDGDGEYELILKWDPSNSKDVSQRGYTGSCLIDCYKLNGQQLWRIDCGPNIRAGAHYTQFMCFDFNNDGKGEIALKTAPGTKIICYDNLGKVVSEKYITLPKKDQQRGVTHEDNYVCSTDDYANHLKEMFRNWTTHPEVVAKHWPQTIEACLEIDPRYDYPLSDADASELVDFFMDDYAPKKSDKNKLREFEGFIFEGPEYLTMFSGLGQEIETIDFPFLREDDGLLWGDYAGNRIEPCNRVDRFLAGVAYLDGIHPALIICRGYYTRACVAAFDFSENKFQTLWTIDSGHVPMDNPFHDTIHNQDGRDPFFGALACQGDHSLSCADVDGDGCMEIIYGGATIDHDGKILYSSKDLLPNGKLAKFGHGDAMHVADIDPDRPGLEIFNVFEEASVAPYGYALRRAEDGTAIFGEYEAVRDLGRCMVGDIRDERGLQCWVNTIGTFDNKGNKLSQETLGTNMSIRYLPDFSTQVTDGADYLTEKGQGIINDFRHGMILAPENTATNNGTKGNPCLVVDLFGDYREELILRTADDQALRIYSNTELSDRKLFTLMHDTQYRCGIAWQNNCYNQPCYPSFYYASDLNSSEILPAMKRKPTFHLIGDSTMQSYAESKRPQFGWGEFLLESLYPKLSQTISQDPNRVFEQEKNYENQVLKIVNHAMAGRSMKTFINEKRLEPVKDSIQTGDYLFIQFAHNDCNEEKKERYLTPDAFAKSLQDFIAIARQKQATAVLLSPIAICKKGIVEDEKLATMDKKITAYGHIARKAATKNKLPFIDINEKAHDYFSALSETESTDYYREDLVHLNEKGARFYADLVTEEIKKWGLF